MGINIYSFSTTRGTILRSEHLRDVLKGQVPTTEEGRSFLDKVQLYFVCSRLDVLLNVQANIVINGGNATIPLYAIKDNGRRIEFVVHLRCTTDILSITKSDHIGRTIAIEHQDGVELCNLAMNPLLRPQYPDECHDAEVLYIGVSNTNGLSGRYRNGHSNYDNAISKVLSQKKNRDAFIFGCCFIHCKGIVNDEGWSTTYETIPSPIDINAVEASLIGYFKPEFNTDYIDFPDKGGDAIKSRMKQDKYCKIKVILETNISFSYGKGIMLNEKNFFYTKHRSLRRVPQHSVTVDLGKLKITCK